MNNWGNLRFHAFYFLIVSETEQNLIEVSNLQAILEQHVLIQSQQIQFLYDESSLAVEKVTEGNKFLIKTKENTSDFRKYILLFLLIASIVLLFLDWYD